MTKITPLPRVRHPQYKVPTDPIGDAIAVRGKLALLGWPSLRSWARAHGYDGQMPGYVVRHWGNRTDRRPHGGIARALMHDLRETLAKGKRPEHVQPQEN